MTLVQGGKKIKLHKYVLLTKTELTNVYFRMIPYTMGKFFKEVFMLEGIKP